MCKSPVTETKEKPVSLEHKEEKETREQESENTRLHQDFRDELRTSNFILDITGCH